MHQRPPIPGGGRRTGDWRRRAVVSSSHSRLRLPVAIAMSMVRLTKHPGPVGGTDYVYSAQTGIQITVPVPPPGFTPLAATAAQLSQYGYPPEPTPTEQGPWRAAMKAATSEPTPNLVFAAGGPQFATPPVRTSGATAPSPTFGADAAWAGWYDYNNSAGSAHLLLNALCPERSWRGLLLPGRLDNGAACATNRHRLAVLLQRWDR